MTLFSTSSRRTSALAFVLHLAACSEPKDAPDAVVQEDYEELGDAILEQATLDPYACELQPSLTSYPQERSWSYTGHDLVTSSQGTVWLVRMSSGEGSASSTLEVSKLDASGALSGTVAIPGLGARGAVSSPRLLAFADGSVGLWWISGNDLLFTSFDDHGSIITPTTLVASNHGLAPRAILRVALASSQKVGAVWLGQDEAAFALVTDSSGSVAEPFAVAERVYEVPNIIAADGGSLALLWQGRAAQYGSPSEVDFALLDTQTGALGSVVRVADLPAINDFLPTFSTGGSTLSKTASGFLAAWAEGTRGVYQQPLQGSGAFSVLRLQPLAADGTALGSARLLEPKTLDVDQVEPSLVPFGDTLAVLWARGSHIYGCGGCVPDHSIKLALIDPETLNLRSNVVQLDPTEGGLLEHDAALSGTGNLVTTFEVRFHTQSYGAFAGFHCSP